MTRLSVRVQKDTVENSEKKGFFNLHIILPIFLAVAPLMGCMGPPLEPLAPPSFPDRWQAAVVESPSAFHAWLDDFSSPRLHDLVNEALLQNHTVRQAAYRRAAARERMAMADALFWPTVQVDWDRSRARSVSGGKAVTRTTYALGGLVSWELDLWGRMAASQRTTASQTMAVEDDWKAARFSLAADVVRHWFAVLASGQQWRLAVQSLASYRRSLEVVEQQYRSGLGEALDLRLVRAEVADAENTLALRRREKEVALRAIEIVLGRYPSGELQADVALPRIVTPVPVGLPSDLLARRPDLRAAEHRLTAAGEQVESARRNRLPTLRLSARSGHSSQALRDLLDWDTLVWNLVAGLVQPVFQGGRLKAEVALARIERKEAWAVYAQALLVAFQEVETALVAETYYRVQEEALVRAKAEASMAADLARSRYQNGLVNIMTLLESQRRAYHAESAQVRVAQERLNNRVTLYLALGGDFQEEEKEKEKNVRPVTKELHP